MPGPIAYYEVRWRLSDATTNWSYMNVDPTESSVKITMDRSRTYQIQARSVGPSGLKSVWVDISHTVQGNYPPPTLSGVGAESAADGVRVYWSVPANAPADTTGCVERATAIGGPFTEVTRTKSHQAYISEKVDGTYYYRVRTTNFRGDYSAYSAVVSASPNTLAEINANIAAAMNTAQNAQAASDGSIQTYFQTTPPASGMTYGDIWFDTDDNRKTYRWDGDSWNYSPNDALAQNILQAIDAQSTADGKVKTYFQPTAPVSGMSLGDLWFNETTEQLFRWDGTDWTQNIGDVTLGQLAGQGINLCPDRYSTFENSTLPTLTAVNCTLSRIASGYITGALRYTITTANLLTYALYNGAAAYITYGYGKKYLVSAFVKCSAVLDPANIFINLKTDTNNVKSVAASIVGGGSSIAANTYVRVCAIIDPTTFVSTDKLMYAYVSVQNVAAAATFEYDGLMVEEAIGSQAVPSNFMRGTSASDVLTAQQAAVNAQNTANTAAADAAQSLNQLDAIGNDSVVTRQEQGTIKANYLEVTNEQSGIDAEADRVAVSRTAYDNALSALKTYLNGLGLVGAGPSYTWTGSTSNISVVAATWDQKWQDVYFNRQTVLNSIAAKVNNQLQNGIMVPPSFGDEMIVNGSFESVVAGQASIGTHVVGTVLCDGWEIIDQSGNGAIVRCGVENSGAGARTGSRTLFLGCLNGVAVSVPNGGGHYVLASMKQAFNVSPNENFVLTGSIREAINAAIPAGLGRQIFMGVRFYDAAGALVSTDSDGRSGYFIDTATQIGDQWTFNRPTRAIVAPANAVKAQIICYLNVFNTSGAAINVPANMVHVRLDDLTLKRVTNPGTSPNMLSNSEFTYGANSWGNITAADVVKVADSYRVSIVKADDGTYTFPYQDVTYSIVTGNLYSASVEIGWGGTITANAYAQLDIQAWSAGFAANLGSVSSRQVFPGAGSGLGTTILTCNGLVLPANTAVLRFVLTFRGGCTWFFRKPKMERNIVAGPYMPGADAGYGAELTYAGSGKQIGDLRNLNPVSPANMGSAWISGSMSYTAAAGSPATATISVSASTLRMGGVDISYNAGSVNVTGTGGTTVTYLLYYDDPTYAGGTRTLGATTGYDTLLNGAGRVYVGKINVTFPTSGSGGGSGVRDCIIETAYVPDRMDYRRASTIAAGQTLESIDPETGREYLAIVSHVSRSKEPCVHVVCENGVIIPCSRSALIPTDKGLVPAGILLGRTIPTKKHGIVDVSLVVDVVDVGWQWVLHITAENGCFFAGLVPGEYGAHHNIKA